MRSHQALSILFVLCIMVSSLQMLTAAAFISSTLHQHIDRMRKVNSQLYAESSKTDAVLRFSASYTYTTSPIYLHRRNETKSSLTLHDFFNSKEHRNCLLIGSNNMKVREPILFKNTKKSLFEACWEKEALCFQKFGVEHANNRHVEILELLIKTPFLVFVINASALVGVILTKDGEKEELFVGNKIHSPEYQFLLLAEDFEAEGPPPLVWIFNQLTGRGSKKGLKPELPNDPHTIHTYLRVWASDVKSYQEGDIKADRIVFKAR